MKTITRPAARLCSFSHQSPTITFLVMLFKTIGQSIRGSISRSIGGSFGGSIRFPIIDDSISIDFLDVGVAITSSIADAVGLAGRAGVSFLVECHKQQEILDPGEGEHEGG